LFKVSWILNLAKFTLIQIRFHVR